MVYTMKKRDQEKDALIALTEAFDQKKDRDPGNFNMDFVDSTIRKFVESPMSDLNLSNFYRLRRYFQDKYFNKVNK